MKMFRKEGEKNRAARGFSICFFFGIAVGTLAGNWLYGREWQRFPLSQWGIWFLGQGPWRLQEGTLEKFFYLLQRRESQGIGAWILGLTLCAAPAYWLLAVWGGLCTGWAITWYTAEKGLMGLPGFFLSCFPQGLFYLPVWGLFVWWGLGRERKLRLGAFLAAAAVLAVGAAAETWINPFFLQLL